MMTDTDPRTVAASLATVERLAFSTVVSFPAQDFGLNVMNLTDLACKMVGPCPRMGRMVKTTVTNGITTVIITPNRSR